MSPRKPFRPDTAQTKSLIKAGKDAAIDALRASKALGLDVTYINNGIIYRESADGTIENIGRVAEIENTHASITKGTILRAK